MAREEHARENLIAEATALVERVELLVAGLPEPVVAGFRPNGSVSLFFADDPVYQFNSRGELRRAFVAGRLYKADNGRLVEMTRNRQAGRVELESRELSMAASMEFIAHFARDSLIWPANWSPAAFKLSPKCRHTVASRSDWASGSGR